jgi:hypothetical protein
MSGTSTGLVNDHDKRVSVSCCDLRWGVWLCNRLVHYLIRVDDDGAFRICVADSAVRRSLIARTDPSKGLTRHNLVVVRGSEAWTHSLQLSRCFAAAVPVKPAVKAHWRVAGNLARRYVPSHRASSPQTC